MINLMFLYTIKTKPSLFNKHFSSIISSILTTFIVAINYDCTNLSATIMTSPCLTPKAKISWLFYAASLFMLMLFSGCHKKHQLIEIDPAYSKYIEAYTSGTISKKSAIRIQLASDANATHTLNEPIDKELFAFTPAVEGKAYWIDARTIEFRPTKDMQVDKLYEVSFKLDEVLKVPGNFSKFQFNVETIKPSFEVTDNGLRAVGKTDMSLSGQLLTADVQESADIEKLLTASVGGQKLVISWQHNEANKTHGFVINNITRTQAAQSLLLQWDGAPLNINIRDIKEIAVPLPAILYLTLVRD